MLFSRNLQLGLSFRQKCISGLGRIKPSLLLALKFVSEDVTDGAIRRGQTAENDVAYLLLFF